MVRLLGGTIRTSQVAGVGVFMPAISTTIACYEGQGPTPPLAYFKQPGKPPSGLKRLYRGVLKHKAKMPSGASVCTKLARINVLVRRKTIS
jgi:hypothetical protein